MPCLRPRHERCQRGTTSPLSALTETLERIGTLQAELRGVHLRAHLAQVEILAPEQIATYDRLRGYAARQHGR